MGRIEDIASKQGWTNETLHVLKDRFIDEKKLSVELADFLQKLADEENNMYELDHNCPICQASNHSAVPLGQLGQLRYVRCRSCGTDYTV